jgi:hypothetical protein
MPKVTLAVPVAPTTAKTSEAQRHIGEAEGKAECFTIEAKPGCCEVPLPSWQMFYIPCNKPATKRIFSPMDGAAYRMCASCANYSVCHRGMLAIG